MPGEKSPGFCFGLGLRLEPRKGQYGRCHYTGRLFLYVLRRLSKEILTSISPRSYTSEILCTWSTDSLGITTYPRV
jgi:hypothetical protein